jgi:hypothetical protein
MIDLTEKLKIAMIKLKINQTQLAALSNKKQPNIAAKLKTNNFKLSEYQKLVEAMGCKLEINIILPDGQVV